jgi:hypothetical protein
VLHGRTVFSVRGQSEAGTTIYKLRFHAQISLVDENIIKKKNNINDAQQLFI